jgi:hypothetical protein
VTFPVAEKTTQKYTATIKDENGTAIPAASLTTLTLTLYEQTTQTIINSRNQQNVLNLQGVTVDAQGLLTWVMTPADNAHLGVAQKEQHVALFEFTYAAGAKRGQAEVLFEVTNTARVT